MSDLEKSIREIFADNRLNEDRIRALVSFFEPVVHDVTPRGTRVQTEIIEVYGLVLGIDAHGRACHVHFPYGADIDD